MFGDSPRLGKFIAVASQALLRDLMELGQKNSPENSKRTEYLPLAIFLGETGELFAPVEKRDSNPSPVIAPSTLAPSETEIASGSRTVRTGCFLEAPVDARRTY